MDTRIIESLNRLRAAENHVATVEEELRMAKDDLRFIRQSEFPELFQTLQLTELELEDGTKLAVERKVYVNVTKEQQPVMLDWLERKGHGDLIKRECTVTFGRGEEEETTLLSDYVRTRFPKHSLKVERSVHHSTLKSFIAKQLNAGVNLPECFGVYSPQEIVVTPPKAEKGERVAF